MYNKTQRISSGTSGVGGFEDLEREGTGEF